MSNYTRTKDPDSEYSNFLQIGKKTAKQSSRKMDNGYKQLRHKKGNCTNPSLYKRMFTHIRNKKI